MSLYSIMHFTGLYIARASAVNKEHSRNGWILCNYCYCDAILYFIRVGIAVFMVEVFSNRVMEEVSAHTGVRVYSLILLRYI